MAANHFEYVDPTAEEKSAWDLYMSKNAAAEAAVTVPIPYAFVLGAVNVAGIVYLRDPVEDSYTEGALVGVVSGTYKLDKSKTSATFYDPTGTLIKVELRADFGDKCLMGRICNRTFTGGWSCTDWTTLASW